MLQRLKWFALGSAVLVAALVTAAWWVASSPTALQWLVVEAMKQSAGMLTMKGVRGSLLGRVQIDEIRYATINVRVTLHDVGLQLSRNALMHGRLEVVGIDARLADIQTTPSDTPLQPPATLALPIDIDLGRVRLAKVHFNDYRATNVTFIYAGGTSGHALQGVSADTHWGRLSGNLHIAAARPFALSGQAEVEAPGQWSAQVVLRGDLMSTTVTARATARGAVVDASARVAPFETLWLSDLRAHGQNLDTAAFIAGFPTSTLEIAVAGASTATGWPAGTITIRNSKPGTITADRLPLAKLSANYAFLDATTVELAKLAADLGAGGAASGSARLTPDASNLNLAVHDLNLRALHAPLRVTRLHGSVKARVSGAAQSVQINVAERGMRVTLSGSRSGDAITLEEFRAQAGTGALQGSGALNLAGSKQFRIETSVDRLDPATLGDYPKAALTGRLRIDGTLAPQWRADIALTLINSLFRGARVSGDASGEITAQGARDLKLALNAGSNTLRAYGSYGRAGDKLAFALDAQRVSELDPGLAGTIIANGRLDSETQQPRLDVEISGKNLVFRNRPPIAQLQMHANGTLGRHLLTLAARGQDFDLNARADGGWDAQHGWTGTLASLRNNGIYPIELLTPMPVTVAREHYRAGPARATVAGGLVTLTALAWRDGRLDTSGAISNLPVAPLLALAGMPAPRTTLRVGGAWSMAASPDLNGRITLARESGDIITPGETAIALGLEALGLEARLVNGALDATLDVRAQILSGSVRATATSLSPAGILKADGRFSMASLRMLDPFIGTQAFVRGNATLTVTGSGTLATPQLGGTLTVANLGIDAPQYGVRLRDGALKAELDDKTLTLREFAIKADEGMISATGTMARAPGGEARVTWRAEHLAVLNRPDMRLKVDGSGTATLAGKKLVLRGTLAADEGRFELDMPRLPRLADDIVIIGRPRPVTESATRTSFQSRLLDVDVMLDAGQRLRVVVAGLNTIVRGKLHLKSDRQGTLEARGVLSSVDGVYFVYGQRLEIERGRLIFDGPIDNPAIDILAKRRNLAVEPGVEVTGSVRVPNVRLISDPPVADSEKLAWLTLGHGSEGMTGADLSLLQSAAAALMGKGDSVPFTQRLANKIGLDELSLRGSGQAGTQVAALGKRLSDRLYIEYQQGLAATSTLLRLSYALTRSLSLRLETGFSTGLGLYFTRSYD